MPFSPILARPPPYGMIFFTISPRLYDSTEKIDKMQISLGTILRGKEKSKEPDGCPDDKSECPARLFDVLTL